MVRHQHVSTDHLTALALVARAPQDNSPETADDSRALAHVAQCGECAKRLANLALDLDNLRDVAFAEADAAFDDTKLDAQRVRVLDRLAHLGQSARVIAFPSRTREVAMPPVQGGRRWISVAAAAGLIIGLVAGQLLHFIPNASVRETAVMRQTTERSMGGIVPASATTLPLLSDDELMEEVETAIELRRVRGLRAIDALTPTPADMLALGRD